MSALTFFHILMGSIALVAGAAAFIARKGETTHRRSGAVFVGAMLAMGTSGAVIAAIKSIPISVIAGVLACYLVLTAMRAAQLRIQGGREWQDIALMLIGIAVGAYALQNAMEISRLPAGIKVPYSANVYVSFAGVALVASVLDARMIWARGVRGKHRLARHVWRMGAAMYLATSAFFLGQSKVFPLAIQRLEVLGPPVLLVVLATLFWLARVLFFKWQMRR